MKIFKNQHFALQTKNQNFDFKEVKHTYFSGTDMYRKLLLLHFEFHTSWEKGNLPEGVCFSLERIAKEAGCSTRTVMRFHDDLHAIIHRKRRFKNGRQTSNLYRMNKKVFQMLSSWKRLGLFKQSFENQKKYFEWIEDMYFNAGGTDLLFMNKVYNRKFHKDKGLQPSCEQSDSTLSLSNGPICHPTIYSLPNISKYSTQKVPLLKKMECEKKTDTILRLAWEDVNWYVSQGKTIRNPQAFLSNRIHYHSAPKRC